jgi:hypothetical protein
MFSLCSVLQKNLPVILCTLKKFVITQNSGANVVPKSENLTAAMVTLLKVGR